MSKVTIKSVKKGDVFSEESHYVYEGPTKQGHEFTHLESGNKITLDDKYVSDLLVTADQFDKEVEVGKEDKVWTAAQIKKENPVGVREGDLRQKGIRSIWADIHSAKVFTVNFNKQGTELSAAKVKAAKDEAIAKGIAAIETAQKNKKGIASAAKAALQELIDNPIQSYVPGEERKLRGYKIQFESINGSYNVIDMDKPKGQGQRQVNVNAINWLVVDGVRYIVK